jgi:hypothetical protein
VTCVTYLRFWEARLSYIRRSIEAQLERDRKRRAKKFALKNC